MFTNSSTNSLVVPIQIEAWVVNNAVLAVSPNDLARGIDRWSLNYSQLENFQSAAHTPFSDNSTIQDTDPGVYLHWTLPSSLRHASQAQTDPNGPMQFPLVPNRWLVVRYSGLTQPRIANGWMIESDYVGTDGSSTFPKLPKKVNQKIILEVGQTNIGRCLPLEGWVETGTGSLFLTAAASGDVHFSIFQSYNNNVFSFQDTLSSTENDHYSYLVTGWYSDLTQDPLAQCQSVGALQSQLDAFQWKINSTTPTTLITQTYFEGIVGNVTNVNADSPDPTVSPDSGNTIHIAVGSSALEALSAFVTQNSPIPPVLFNALNSGLLDRLEEPDAGSCITDALHAGEFGHQSGGTRWTITPLTSQSSESTLSILTLSSDLAEQLDDLNRQQQIIEQQQAILEKMQWDLYALWWKQGYGSNADPDPDFPGNPLTPILARISQSFDPTNSASLVSQVSPQQTFLSTLITTIMGLKNTLEQALATQNMTLKNISDVPMYHPKDPVVLVTGISSSAILNKTAQDGLLPCRYLNECTANNNTPIPTPSGFPTTLENLLQEFFCVDTGQLNLLQGPQPFFGLTSWSQPFSPLFMEWEIEWLTLPFPNWTYGNGRYVLTTVPTASPSYQTINDINITTPHAVFAFKAQLQRLIDQDPSFKIQFPNWPAIQEAIDNWPVLAFSLSGFHQQLVQRDISMNRAPIASDNTSSVNFQTLIGNQAHDAPIPGSFFQPVRAGQFYFNHVTLVSRFGQSINIVQPDSQVGGLSGNYASLCKPFISDSLKPDIPAEPINPLRFVQLSPRVVQPMRLKSDWLLANDDSNSKPIELNCQANPIAGWVLPNYLDQSFQCFSPEGQNLGELSVIEDMNGNKICSWQAAYNSSYSTLEAMESTLPWISGFLSSFVGTSTTQPVTNPTQAFEALMDIIDLMLTSKLSGSSSYNTYLSAVIGPIFAMARVAWQLELEQPPYQDQSWEQTCMPDVQTYQDYSFKIQLGSTERSQSGLLGYFEYDKGFNQFYSLYTPDSPSDYIQSTENNCFSLTPNSRGNAIPQLTTVLMDPFDKVYAYSDILPVQYLQLPSLFVQSALKNIAVTFRQGPLLTRESTIDLVLPSSIQGKWSWLDPQSEGSMQELATVPAKTNACFTGESSEIRQGFLLFKPAAFQQDPSHQYAQGAPR